MNCGACMGIERVTLHRGAASGATTIKGALCNRTWCYISFGLVWLTIIGKILRY